MNNKEIEQLVEKIKKLSETISSEFYQQHMQRTYQEHPYEEFPGYTDMWIKYSLKDMYYLILTYFEVKNLGRSYDLFRERFDRIIDEEVDLLATEQYHPETEDELKLVHDFFMILSTHSDFHREFRKDDSLLRVYGILKNTNHIIKRMGVTIIGEADIYKPVRWIIGLYFPNTRRQNKASFIQEFKTYHPDILIPELKTAIEYKYIKTKEENRVEDYIDDLKTDSVNYVNDFRYDNFIAVIYMKSSGLTTPERIKECWKSKEFPKSWKLIISTD